MLDTLRKKTWLSLFKGITPQSALQIARLFEFDIKKAFIELEGYLSFALLFDCQKTEK